MYLIIICNFLAKVLSSKLTISTHRENRPDKSISIFVTNANHIIADGEI